MGFECCYYAVHTIWCVEGGACIFRADTNIQSRRGNMLMVFHIQLLNVISCKQPWRQTSCSVIIQDKFKLLSIQHTAGGY